jgi:preprotein translocase subunit SecD
LGGRLSFTLANKKPTTQKNKNMKAILLTLIVISGISHAGILGLHRVVSKSAKDSVEYRMKAGHKLKAETLWLQKTPFITEASVKHARVDANDIYSITIILNQEGSRKMEAVTGAMNHGQDRVGIVVDGKLLSAPVVRSNSGKMFIVTLPEAYTLKEADLFIKALNKKKEG